MITEKSAATEAQIIDLRRERLPWREIGSRVGLSHEQCRKIFNAAVCRYPAENLAVMRVEESELADDAICTLRAMVANPAVTDRNRIEAFKVLLAWSESKRKLHGVDAPIKREIEIIDTSSMDAQLRAEIDQLEREARAAEAMRQ